MNDYDRFLDHNNRELHRLAVVVLRAGFCNEQENPAVAKVLGQVLNGWVRRGERWEHAMQKLDRSLVWFPTSRMWAAVLDRLLINERRIVLDVTGRAVLSMRPPPPGDLAFVQVEGNEPDTFTGFRFDPYR